MDSLAGGSGVGAERPPPTAGKGSL